MARIQIYSRGMFGIAVLAIAALLIGTVGAEAHHPMGGLTPETFAQGLLSGLGHPVIGIDHLVFIVAMGVAAGVAGLGLAMPGIFVAASAAGVALHVQAVTLPAVEVAVAVSVLVIGLMLAAGRKMPRSGWAALFALAGLFHGYAFGESIVGAEPLPLAAYLTGLVVVQTLIATGVTLLARWAMTDTLKPRLAGAAFAAIGFVIVGAQVFSA